ncbi:hypothetical protein Corgl_1741 [Coriobacterium glomerans PW2]|uniref:CRISPR-associated protein, Csn2 family n=1 Tax=Coriobacterium glomerans (strain ATCC 49209 / DSM 20642 / JCM 10262 / PW2) TaxID=700015 RepID=F2N988_CORGP|nr:type II-A CRISPR-associated protein Csn2 [Coriobacterium glomerans]AEB07836.1 hypothetical protein Corgl_1741 [Coriobacterium glomerans PW2]
MRIVFSGLERPIDIEPGLPTVLQVENSSLFTRLCLSLRSGEEREAIEPYVIWRGEKEIATRDALMFIGDPMLLPWDDRALMGSISKRFEKELIEDEELRRTLEDAAVALSSQVASLGLSMYGDYSFAIEWDLKRFIKAFGFGAHPNPQETFLDNLIDFLSFVLDIQCSKVMVFVNLKTFLTEIELEKLYEHVFFSKTRVLLLENKADPNRHENEIKTTIDLDFIEK